MVLDYVALLVVVGIVALTLAVHHMRKSGYDGRDGQNDAR